MQKDAYQVLRQRELEVERVRREIESLRAVIPLLDLEEESAAERDSFSPPPEAGNNGNEQTEPNPAPKFWTFGRKKEAKA